MSDVRVKCNIPSSIAFWGQRQLVRGNPPETPWQKGKEKSMNEALFFTIGLIIGIMAGVLTMCVIQINRYEKEQENE